MRLRLAGLLVVLCGLVAAAGAMAVHRGLEEAEMPEGVWNRRVIEAGLPEYADRLSPAVQSHCRQQGQAQTVHETHPTDSQRPTVQMPGQSNWHAPSLNLWR